MKRTYMIQTLNYMVQSMTMTPEEINEMIQGWDMKSVNGVQYVIEK